jgi:hypothetical protein
MQLFFYPRFNVADCGHVWMFINCLSKGTTLSAVNTALITVSENIFLNSLSGRFLL